MRYEKGKKANQVSKRLTRADKNKLREEWREAKQQQRARWSRERRDFENRRRRERYRSRKKLDFTGEAEEEEKIDANEMIRLMNQSTPETQKQLKVGEFSFTPKSIRWNETNRRIVNNLNDRLKGIKKDGVI